MVEVGFKNHVTDSIILFMIGKMKYLTELLLLINIISQFCRLNSLVLGMRKIGRRIYRFQDLGASDLLILRS